MQRRWFFLEAARALEVIIFYFRIPPYRGEVIVLGEDDFEAWGGGGGGGCAAASNLEDLEI